MPDYSDRAALESEICRLQQEISRLHLLLDQAGINYEQTSIQEETQDTVLPVPITEAHAKLLKVSPPFSGVVGAASLATSFSKPQNALFPSLVSVVTHPAAEEA